MGKKILNFVVDFLDRVMIELQGVKYSEYQNAIDEYNKLLLEPDDFDEMKVENKIKQLKSGRDLLNERKK